MHPIGLIAAMTQESDALLRTIKGWTSIRIGPYHGNRFEISGQSCILVTAGMGIRRAGDATRSLIEIVFPQFIVSFGIAGAVEADLEIGDVVAPEAVCLFDKGGYSPLLRLNPWTDAARERAALILANRGARLFTGTAVTTRGSQINESQSAALKHPVLEMETAGIAQAAAEKGIPVLSLRAISDSPREPIPFNLSEMMDEDANLQADKMIKAILQRPRILLQSMRLMKNTRKAAENAAVALIAALSQPVLLE